MKLIMPQGISLVAEVNGAELLSGCICHSGSQVTKYDYGYSSNCGCSCINDNTTNRGANHNIAYA